MVTLTFWHWVGIIQLFTLLASSNIFFYLYHRKLKKKCAQRLALAESAIKKASDLKEKLAQIKANILAKTEEPISQENPQIEEMGLTLSSTDDPLTFLDKLQKEAELRLQDLGIYSTDFDPSLDAQQQTALLRYHFAEAEKKVFAVENDPILIWEIIDGALHTLIHKSPEQESGTNLNESMTNQLMEDNATLNKELEEEKEKFKKAADYWKSKLKEIKKGYPLLLENLKENNEESLMSDLNNLYSAYIETGYLLDQNSMELTHDSDLETIQKEQKKVPLDEEKSEEKNKKHFSYEEVGTLNNIINAQMSEIKELRDEFNKNEKLSSIKADLEKKLIRFESKIKETESCILMLEKKIKEDQDENYVEKTKERKDKLKGELRSKELISLMKKEHQLMINQSLPNKNKHDLIISTDRLVNYMIEMGSYLGVSENRIDSSSLISKVIDQSSKEAAALKKDSLFAQSKETAKPVLESAATEVNKLKLVFYKQRTVINKLVERIQHLEKHEDKIQFIEEYEANVKQLDSILKENNTCIEMLEKELDGANNNINTLENELTYLKQQLEMAENERSEKEAENQKQNEALLMKNANKNNAEANNIEEKIETLETPIPILTVKDTPTNKEFNQFGLQSEPDTEEQIDFDSPL